MIKKACIIFGISLVVQITFLSEALAISTTTTLNQTITSGSLTINSPGSFSLPLTEVNSTNQTISGTLSTINVYDQRGTGAGWSSSMDIQHLTITKNPISKTGNTSPIITLNASSRYNGICGITSPHTSYKIKISFGGNIGTAKYTVTGGCGDTNQTDVITTGTENNVGSRGISIDFPTGNYAVDDEWTILVDIYAYTDVKITPQTPTSAVTGSDLTGVNASSTSFLAGSGTASNTKILLTANIDKGMGSYNQNINLELIVHGNALSGNYSGTLSVTVS